MNFRALYADVILPLAAPQLYTYKVPPELANGLMPGVRVVVQFGRQKIYSALVKHLHQQAPTDYQVKEILSVLDEAPVVNALQLQLWDWICSYYMCHPGEVMITALPVALKLQSETRIIINKEHKNTETLNDKEFLVLEALEQNQVLTVDKISELLSQKAVHNIIKSLLDKDLVRIEEELKERSRPLKKNLCRPRSRIPRGN